jgi:ribosome-binding protein aMBF1 (putative translation factor)
MSKELGQIIKTARETKVGLDQEELAKLLDVTQQAVSEWEVGDNEPNKEHKEMLKKVLGITL